MDAYSLLVEPVSGAALKLEESRLVGPANNYPIVDGIPRFVSQVDQNQQKTGETYEFFWSRDSSFDSEANRARMQAWLIERNGFQDMAGMVKYYAGRERILDAGCGNGLSSSLWLDQVETPWWGVDLTAAVDKARAHLGHLPHAHFVQADLMELPFPEASFDTIVSEGVLHHTPSTEAALKQLSRHLAPGGDFLFYVYRRRGPIREYTNDYVREIISAMPPEEAWEAMRPLTKLAQSLAELQVEVEVPEDIPYLEIPAGRYDVQRLLYWHFAKMFWDPNQSFDENNDANFDWYHARYAHRQREDEVRRWCAEAGLEITHFNAQPGGYAVRARRTF